MFTLRDRYYIRQIRNVYSIYLYLGNRTKRNVYYNARNLCIDRVCLPVRGWPKAVWKIKGRKTSQYDKQNFQGSFSNFYVHGGPRHCVVITLWQKFDWGYPISVNLPTIYVWKINLEKTSKSTCFLSRDIFSGLSTQTLLSFLNTADVVLGLEK